MGKKQGEQKKPNYGYGVDPKDPSTWQGAYVNINGTLFDQNKWDTCPAKTPPGLYRVITYVPSAKNSDGTYTKASLHVIDGNNRTTIIHFIAPKNPNKPKAKPKADPNKPQPSPSPGPAPTAIENTPVDPNGPDPTTGSTTTKDIIMLKPSDVDKGVGRFNPPPHRASRSVTPLLFPGQSEAFAEKYKEFNTRGIIFMDSDTAQHNNGKSYTRKDMWGFQFLYNPNSISYTNAANTSIDFTNQLDVALLLTGSQQVTISLLLYRVPDMGIVIPMARKYKKHEIMIVDTGENYNRKLTADEVLQLADRGTDFDLEFLYRVLNGDPMQSPQSDYSTSDFGYISGMPVWIRLNDQMRYKGTIGSIQVNHTMFTRTMVPIVSEVTISFIRIPTMGYDSSDKHIKKRFTTGTGDNTVSRIPQYTAKSSDTSGG